MVGIIKDMALSVKKNYNLFDTVARGFDKQVNLNKDYYSILDYEKILNDMKNFISGYFAAKDDGKYSSRQIVTLTIQFFDKMFTDPKYRKIFQLNEFPEINRNYLVSTKDLMATVDTFTAEYKPNKKMDKNPGETENMLVLCSKQFDKLAKVKGDDMQIFLWLASREGAVFNKKTLSDELTTAYYNTKTPVMHRSKKVFL